MSCQGHDDDKIKVLKESAEKLFDSDSFTIPFFQRPYVWEERLWEQFLKDVKVVSDKDIEHFMGFILFKGGTANRGKKFSVIDGQQRLTTFFLFARALCEVNEKSFGKEKFFPNDGKIILTHNLIDKPIFEKILENGCLDPKEEERHENNKILQCYNYFYKTKKECLEKINVDRVLKKLFFVTLCLEPEDDEQKIFDRMNSSATPLTVGDLLKNELFISDSNLSKKAIDVYKETWMETFEKDEETRDYWDTKITAGKSDVQTNLFLLLRYFAEIKKINIHSTDKLFIRYRDFLNENKEEKENLIYELMDYAREYREHIKPDCLGKQIDVTHLTGRMNIIMFGFTSTIISYVLYILKEVETEDEKREIFRILESYIMRRIVVGAKDKNYNRQFVGYIHNQINSADKLQEILYKEEKNDDSDTVMPQNSLIEKLVLTRGIKNSNAKLALYFLEHHLLIDDAGDSLLAYAYYSIDHIMPKSWLEHWNNPPLEADETEIRNWMVLTLGNLTLLRPNYNSKLRNLGWDAKRNGVEAQGKRKEMPGLLHCCTGQPTFYGYVLSEEPWNESKIGQRNEELIEHIKNLWPYEEPEETDEEDIAEPSDTNE